MIHHCGLNRLNQFATFLTTHLRSARHDSEMRSSLRNLDEILYSGLALASEEEDWAYQNGIKLRVCRDICFLRQFNHLDDRICSGVQSAVL
jgi:hypothetical protein